MKNVQSLAKETQNQRIFDLYKSDPITLGPYSSYMWRQDPRHLGFLFARYKFVAKMLRGQKTVLEVGCGDAVGTPIVAKEVGSVHCLDFEPLLLEDNRERISKRYPNITFGVHDFTEKPATPKSDAVFSLDVIEHIKPNEESKFMDNISGSLGSHGMCIIGTPNITAHAYASSVSQQGHINLKDYASLEQLMRKYFNQVLLFSMNDEVVHTGFYPLAHYLIAIGINQLK